jgi:hypothetical protein
LLASRNADPRCPAHQFPQEDPQIEQVLEPVLDLFSTRLGRLATRPSRSSPVSCTGVDNCVERARVRLPRTHDAELWWWPGPVRQHDPSRFRHTIRPTTITPSTPGPSGTTGEESSRGRAHDTTAAEYE